MFIWLSQIFSVSDDTNHTFTTSYFPNGLAILETLSLNLSGNELGVPGKEGLPKSYKSF